MYAQPADEKCCDPRWKLPRYSDHEGIVGALFNALPRTLGCALTRHHMFLSAHGVADRFRSAFGSLERPQMTQ